MLVSSITAQKIAFLTQFHPTPVIEWDKSGCVTAWNTATSELLGYSEQDVLGQPLALKLFSPTIQQLFRSILQDSTLQPSEAGVLNSDPVCWTCETLTLGGAWMECSWSCLPLSDQSGVVGMISMVRAIAPPPLSNHAPKPPSIEAELRRSKAFLQLVIDNIPQHIFWKDHDSVYLGCNQYLAAAVGLENPQAIVGKTDYDLPIPIAEAEMYRRTDREVIQSNQPVFHETQPITTAEGQKIWIDANKIPLQDDNGNVVGILGTYEDITDRKEVELKLQKTLQQSENRLNLLRNVINASADRIFVKDLDTRYILVNESFAQGLGRSVNEVLGKSDWELGYPPELIVGDSAQGIIGFQESDRAVLQGKAVHVANDRAIAPDGSLHYLDTQKTPLRDTAGKIFGILGICRDITQRCETEQAMRDAQDFLNTIIDAIPDPLFVKDEEHRWILVNQAFASFLGHSREFLLGKSDHDISPKEEADIFWEQDDLVFRMKQERVNEEYHTDLTGNRRYISTKKTVFEEASGKQILVGTIRDLTDRKCIEEELQASEARFQRLTTNVPGMIYQYRLTPEGRQEFPYASAFSREIYGIEPEMIQSDPALILNCIHPKDQLGFAATVQISAQTLQPFEWTGRIISPATEEVHWIQACSRPATQADGSILWDGIMIDVTAKRQAEVKITQISKAIDGASDAIGMADLSGNSTYQNAAFIEMFGYTVEALNAAGGPQAIYANPTEFAKVFAALNAGESWRGEITARHCDGSAFPVELRADVVRNQSGQIVGLVGIHTDISDRKRIEAERQQASEVIRQSEMQLRQKAEELEQALKDLQMAQAQLIQSEKMSSLGQLVAGVAHEINNPVSFIYGNLFHAHRYVQDLVGLMELYQQISDVPADITKQAKKIDLPFLLQDLPKLLSSMQIGADRIQEIVKSLRTFSRKDESELKQVDIHEGLDSTLLILRNRLKEQPHRSEIELTKDYCNLPLVECYPGPLNQVFMNILSNAIDALDERCEDIEILELENENLYMGGYMGGHTAGIIPKIHVSTQLILDVDSTELDVPRLEIRISDNGIGIPEVIQQRIFDPFFTTKPVGKGTGMGMSISYQIITEKHQGLFRCESSPGQGTTFVIEIPVSQKRVSEIQQFI